MHRLHQWTASLSVAAALLAPVNVIEGQGASAPRVQAIRFWSFGDVTRVAIQTEGEYRLKSDQIETPPRLYFDLKGLQAPAAAHRGLETIQVGDRRVKQIRVAQVGAGLTRIVFDLESPVEVVSSQLVNPDRLMIEVRPKQTSVAGLSITRSLTGSQQAPSSTTPPAIVATPAKSTPDVTPSTSSDRTLTPKTAPQQTVLTPAPTIKTPALVTSINSPAIAHPPITVTPVPPAPVTIAPPALTSSAKIASEGDRSLVRVFGLKLGRVVIDAGHGGHDTGTIGPGGLLEKNLVLDVALRLGALVKTRLSAEVVYTRSSDVFLPLEERTKLANDQKADLFISIHANSSPEPTATGVETYYFNFTSDRRSLDLATRENATATSAISDLNDLLHRAVLQTKLEESREFAQRVQTSLWGMSARMNGKSRDRGVRQAPFVVLIGATMPSILAEVGFVSNPHDEKLMKRIDQRERIAEALFKGVSQYASSLSHQQLARASN